MFNSEADLTVPAGIHLKSIAVSIEIEPPSAGCLIYGFDQNGELASVKVSGGMTELELPFARRHIYFCYLEGLKRIKIHTRGWRKQR